MVYIILHKYYKHIYITKYNTDDITNKDKMNYIKQILINATNESLNAAKQNPSIVGKQIFIECVFKNNIVFNYYYH